MIPQNKARSVAEFLLGRQVNDIRAVRYGLYALYTFGSGDYEPKDVAATLKLLSKGPKGLRIIKRTLDYINELDDNLDLLTPEQIVALGDVKLGTEPSPLLSSSFISEDMRKMAEIIAKNKLMPMDEIVSFQNLATYFIVEEAKWAVEYQRSHSIESREALVEMHLRQTEITGAFVMHLFKRDKAITEHLKNGGVLDYDFLAGHYQHLFEMCRLTQYKDDILDLYKDALAEAVTKRPLPNTVMLESERAGALHGTDSHLGTDYQRLANIIIPEASRLPFERLPPEVRRAVSVVIKDYKERAATYPRAMRELLLADIKHVLADGVYITGNGALEDNERKWHQRFALSSFTPSVPGIR